jgi:tetratricopeptide (TPR) repeat protein
MLLACCGGSQKTIEPAPSTVELVDEARGLERRREYLKAQAVYERAFASAPDKRSKVWAGRALSSALIAWGMYAEAETALDEIVQVAPEDVASWHDLGLLRYQRRAYIGAERALRRSIELRPGDPRSHEALGALLVNRRRYGEAITVYETMKKLDLPAQKRDAVEKALELLHRQRALER